jgi:hypothetical protein
MPSAARESAGSDESPKPHAYPVHVESLSDGVAQLLGRKTDNPVSLDDEQSSTASSPAVSQAAELDRAGTLADAAPSQASDLQFIPSELQERILEVLDQKALTLDTLVLKLQVDRSTLHRNGIKELMQRGLICNHRRVGGYYRPDAPPPQYADKLGKTSR